MKIETAILCNEGHGALQVASVRACNSNSLKTISGTTPWSAVKIATRIAEPLESQRRQHDTMNSIFVLHGLGDWWEEGRNVQNPLSLGNLHDNLLGFAH